MKLQLQDPVSPFFINQSFGGNPEYYAKLGIKGHNGLDLWADDGTEVRAAHDGEITFAGEDGAGGLTIVIRTLQEFNYEGGKSYFKTIYCHLKRGSIVTTPHQKVKAGELLAQADNTGMSTGSHLHFGLKPIFPGEQDWQWYNLESTNGYNGAIDPLPYMTGRLISRFVFTKNLIRGTTSNDVLELQKILSMPKDLQTGYFGWRTLGYVMLFQIRWGITPTGFVGPVTREKLNT